MSIVEQVTCPKAVGYDTYHEQEILCGAPLNYDDEKELYVCPRCGFQIRYFCQRCGAAHIAGQFSVCCDFDDRGGNDM